MASVRFSFNASLAWYIDGYFFIQKQLTFWSCYILISFLENAHNRHHIDEMRERTLKRPFMNSKSRTCTMHILLMVYFLVFMMTSSNGNIFRVTGPLRGEFTGPGEFPAQRPVPRSFDVFFDLSLNKRLSKQPWGWWFETPPRSLWRQCNVLVLFYM